MIVITSKKDGFRRCGIAHAAKATSYPDGQFTDEQLAILQAETMLIVVVTDGEQDGKANESKTWTKAEIKAAAKEQARKAEEDAAAKAAESKAAEDKTKTPDILDRDK